MRRRKPSPATIMAALALFVALGGTAIAADHYVITSTSQIKPSVLRELGNLGVSFDRIRSVPVKTASAEEVKVPLSPAAWVQGPNEIDQLAVEYDISTPSAAECGPPITFSNGTTAERSVTLSLSYEPNGGSQGESVTIGSAATTVRRPFHLFQEVPFFEPGKPTTRRLGVRATDDCTTGAHATVNWVHIDVIRFHLPPNKA